MPDFLSQFISREALRHPALAYLAVALLLSSGALLVNPFVTASEFDDFQQKEFQPFKTETNKQLHVLQGQMSDVRREVAVRSKEGQLRAVETDLWNLQRLIDQGQGNERDVKRLNQLRSDANQLERDIERLCQDGGCRVAE